MRSAAHLELVRELDATALSDTALSDTALSSVGLTTAANLARERTLPVVDELAGLVPTSGLQRGSTLAVHGVGATSLALALAGQAVREGSFLAIVAPQSFGLAACLDFDIPLRRVVQFVLPNDVANWAQAVAAIIEGFDVVMLADRHQVSASHARQLVARNRERGSVLVRVGGAAWPDAADLRFEVGSPDWQGLGQGNGHLRSRRVEVQVAGRRYHGGNRTHEILLPAADGGVQLAPALIPAAQHGVAQHGVAQRFAGADIDAMLDVVDEVGQADGSGADQDHDALDLNATA